MKSRSISHTLHVICFASTFVLFPLPAHAGVGDYFADRWFDFADIFGARVSAAKGGKSAGIMVRATTLAQAGLVYFNGQHAGMDRRAVGVWREKRFHWALGPLAWNDIEMRTRTGNSFAQEDSAWNEAEERGIVRNGYYYDDGRGDFLGLGVELQPGILPGFELRLNPLQVLDFLMGWTTIDVFDDDEPSNNDESAWLPENASSESLPEDTIVIQEYNSGPAVELAPSDSQLPAAPLPSSSPAPAAGDIPLPR